MNEIYISQVAYLYKKYITYAKSFFEGIKFVDGKPEWFIMCVK